MLRIASSLRNFRAIVNLSQIRPFSVAYDVSVNEFMNRKIEAPKHLFNFDPKTTPGYGRSKHKSNRAKEGLYHGKTIQFGHSISHSHVRSKRRWNPNVITKRVFSYALDDFIFFKMTTKTLKMIDYCGGIDNYLFRLREKDVILSRYVTKMRNLIASTLYYRGLLGETLVVKLGYDITPPLKPEEIKETIGYYSTVMNIKHRRHLKKNQHKRNENNDIGILPINDDISDTSDLKNS
jgi:large subunit ribosomal protein L28